MLESIISQPYWQNVYLGNTVWSYAVALVLVVVFMYGFKWLQKFILRRLDALAQKTSTDIDDVVIEIVNSFRPPFYSFIAIYLAVKTLHLNDWMDKVLDAALIIWITYQVISAVQILVNYIAKKALGKEEDEHSKSAIKLLGSIVKSILWVVGIMIVLSNLGVDITSLIAGIGIGGIAIALALQNILSDLFSSFSLYFDKPFKVGDHIVVGKHAGTVEKIGIKTTRIRSVQGEEIIVANQELTSAQVQNFKRLERRRNLITLGVTYETPVTKLKMIPKIVQDIIESEKEATFSRAHFQSFGDSALNYQVVYYVEVQDYGVFMDIQQSINFAIMEAFEKEGIEFAYPTQTVYVSKKTE